MKYKNPLIVVLLALTAITGSAEEYALTLEEAVRTESSQGDFPLQIYLRESGGVFSDGIALSPYSSVNGSGGLYETYAVDVSGLSLSNDEITGTLTTTVENVDIAAEISVHDRGQGRLRGVYHDQNRPTQQVRGIEGRVSDGFDPSAATEATLFLQNGVPPGRKGENVFWSFAHENGSVGEVSLHYAELLNSLFGSDTGEPQQSPFINADGVETAHMGGNGGAFTLNVVSHNLSLTPTTVSGETTFDVITDSGSERYVYVLDASMIAGYIFGSVTTLDDAGNEVDAAYRVAGHIAEPEARLTADPVVPLTPAPAQSGSAFAPPYFNEISQEDFRERLRTAALWFGQSDYVGAYMSDLTAVLTQHTNNKQYDNGSENTYAGVMGLLMLHRLSEDPEMAEQALRAAQRAGYWGQAKGSGRYNVQAPYKAQFFTTFWQAWAFLELYLQTGDVEWRNNALRYANGLKELQELMYEQTKQRGLALSGNDIGGTWTYYTPSGGYAMGQSNSRDDRSRDWEPLQCGEFLYFLGRLRVEAGVTDFLDVERKAYDWMRANLEDDWAWITNQDFSRDKGGHGPSAFLLYLLHYAESTTDADIDMVINFVENTHTSWEHDGSRLSPAVNNSPKRRQANDGADAASTLRMALVYLGLHERRGDTVYLDKAKALVYSVLSRQNSYGYVHHNGLKFTNPGAADSFAVRYNERTGHSYANLSAETLNLLSQCYDQLAQLDAFDGSAVRVDLQADTLTGTVPLTVAFDASASTGSGLSYSWDFDDGQQASTAAPSHTFSEEGNYIVTLKVQAGDKVDTQQVTIRVRQPQVLSRIEVESVEKIWWQNPIDFFDPVHYLKVSTSRPYEATAFDQYGDPLATQPSFTWSTTGGNTVDENGVLEASPAATDIVDQELIATADDGEEMVSGVKIFRVVGEPSSEHRGFSINFYKNSAFSVSQPGFSGGVIRLNQWRNFDPARWGNGRGIDALIEDNVAEHTLKVDTSRNHYVWNSGNNLPVTGTNVLINEDHLVFSDDEPEGLVLSQVPADYRNSSYDLYVIAHRKSSATYSISVRLDDGATQTFWLKGNPDVWDGSEFKPATATSEAEATAGTWTNHVHLPNLSAERIDVRSSYGISAIQVVQSGGDSPPGTSPTIDIQPVGASLEAGGSHTFTVAAGGDEPLAYQWFKDGEAINGATAGSFTIDPAGVSDSGSYVVEVSNQSGTTTSDPAILDISGIQLNLITPPGVGTLTFGQRLDEAVISGGEVAESASGDPVDGSFAFVEGDLMPEVGTGDQTVVFTPDDGFTYETVSGPVSVTVNPADATVTLSDLTVTYNGQAQSSTVTTDPAGLEVTITYDGGGSAPSAVGSYAVEVTVSDPAASGSASGTFTIDAAPLTVQADDAAKFEGDPDPALTWTITAGQLFGADSLIGDISRESGEAIGSYAITQGTLAAPANYVLTFQSGLFSVLEASDAPWVLQSDFDGLTPGNLHGQDGWSGVNDSAAEVLADPADAANQIFKFAPNNNDGISKAFSTPIQTGDVATIFFRFRVPAGDSRINQQIFRFPASSNEDNRSYSIRLKWDSQSSDPVLWTYDVDMNDDYKQQVEQNILRDIWYNFWVVIDNANGLYRLYIQGDAFETQTLVTSANLDDTNTDSHPFYPDLIEKLAFKGWDNAPVLYDDFYLAHGGENLSNPVAVIPPRETFDTWIDGYPDLNSGERGPLDTLAGDGIPNVLKYAFGLDPMDAQAGDKRASETEDGFPVLQRTQDSTSGIALRYRRDTALTDLTFRPEWSAALGGTENWQEDFLEQHVLSTDNGVEWVEVRFTDAVPPSQQFLRIAVEY